MSTPGNRMAAPAAMSRPVIAAYHGGMDTALVESRPLSAGEVTRWQALLAETMGGAPEQEALELVRRRNHELAQAATE